MSTAQSRRDTLAAVVAVITALLDPAAPGADRALDGALDAAYKELDGTDGYEAVSGFSAVIVTLLDQLAMATDRDREAIWQELVHAMTAGALRGEDDA